MNKKPDGRSRLIDGMVIPPTHLELIVADHCNINCKSCNHASPVMRAWFADPETVYRDYSVLAKYYRPAFIKVLGGEPLMHRQLDAVIRAARASGISDRFVLTTNGTLLDRASDAIWDAVDEVEISAYPGVPGLDGQIRLAQEKARALGKKVTVYRYEQFRGTFGLRGSTDRALIGRIHAACKIANLWGCHAVREGYFYKCPQSIYTAKLTGRSVAGDRLPIVDEAGFPAALLDFVNSPSPLAACAHCVGTVGRQEPHALLPRAQWHDHLDASLEQLVDHDWLERCLLTQDCNDDCKIPTRFKIPRVLARNPWLEQCVRAILPASVRLGTWRSGKAPVRQAAAATRRELADIDNLE